MISPWVVLAAGLIEGGVSYPAKWRHPVAAPAWLISRMERAWNRPDLPQKAYGLMSVVLLLAAAIAVGFLIQTLAGPLAPIVVAVVGAFGLAGRSLYDHVSAIEAPLTSADLPAAREMVGRIVGRDVDRLTEKGVASAALESLAESFNDGLVAPVFWFLVGGLPGLFAYKAINTADSMIGHMEERYRLFGWAAARTDDLMNLIPARIAGGLITLAAGRGWKTMLRDAGKHASPNAGWPEAAMAGALNVTLGGPVMYDGAVANRAKLGDGPHPRAADLKRGLTVYLRACALLGAALILGGLAWSYL